MDALGIMEECPGPSENPAVEWGQEGSGSEGSPGPDHLRQVGMGHTLVASVECELGRGGASGIGA